MDGERRRLPSLGRMYGERLPRFRRKGDARGFTQFRSSGLAHVGLQPGTYDPLSHMMFTPLPTSGSSGGPIVDEETGAVVGMVLGSQMDGSRVDGMRGWGVPAEVIFEVCRILLNLVSEKGQQLLQMFSLPGLEGKK